MAANNLGTAYIKIAPQMEGIQSSITRQLSGAMKSSAAQVSAIGTVVSKGVSKAVNLVSNSMDYAVQRADMLNTFPRIMKNLGFSAEESSASVKKLSDRIEGLPTTLDEMVSYTKRLASSTGNLNQGFKNATSIAIAFNDAALAGSSSQEEANRAFEQFIQVVSRGRPSMQDWKIMMEVMPGPLKQIAKYMGENNESLKAYAKQAGKTAEQLDGMDLYQWISAEKNANAKQRIDELTTALVELDVNGGAGITSFKNQVGDATHTIGNAMRLIPIRVGKAVAQIISSFGTDNIYKVIDKFTSSFSKVGDFISNTIVPAIKNGLIPVMRNAVDAGKNVVSFIKNNAYVSDILKNLLGVIVAFKAVDIVGTKLQLFGTAFLGAVKNVQTGVEAFKAASAAGLTTSSAFGAAASATTGATSAIASFAQVATSAAGAIGGLVVVGLTGLQAAFYGNKIDANRASIAAREYALATYDAKKASDDAARSIELQKLALQDLKDAELASTNAEIAALEYKRQAASYQEEMNRLKKEGKQNTDEYRLAELNYSKSVALEKKANEELAESQKVVNDRKEKLVDNQLTSIYAANKEIATLMREEGQYGSLAAQLDLLKDETIQYKDEHGNMVTATKERTADMVQGLAEQLASGNSKTAAIWRQIVDTANKEGISFAEACAKAAKEGADLWGGNFSTGIKKGTPLMVTSLDEANKALKGKLRASAEDYTVIGQEITNGIAKGAKNSQVVKNLKSTLISVSSEAFSTVKNWWGIFSPSRVMAEIGKYIDLGLAKGIDDYADDVAESLENVSETALGAFNGGQEFGATSTQLQPYNGLTSGMNGLAGQVTQYNTFNQVDSDLDMQEISKRLGWQVATAL